MRLSVNMNTLDLPDGTTVAGLLETLGRHGRGIAVAVNEEVVPRSTWSQVELLGDDRVEVLVAAQGG